MSKNILLFTDSLSLPRSQPENCSFSNTWPELLRKNGYSVCQIAIGGATSTELLKQTFYFQSPKSEFDYVIIQSGIVDCTPRFAGKNELKIIKSIPVLGKYFLQGMNKQWVRNLRHITYVKPSKFKKNLQQFIDLFPASKVLFLSILPANSDYEKKVGGITKRIAQYNSILQETGSVIDLNGMESSGIMSDYHHLNEKGHAYVLQCLLQKLNGNGEL